MGAGKSDSQLKPVAAFDLICVKYLLPEKFNSTKSSTNIKIKHRHCGASMAMFEMFLVPFLPLRMPACQSVSICG
jgi:hypothetical protein